MRDSLEAAAWLTGLVLEASKLVSPEAAGLKRKGSYEGSAGMFEIYGVGDDAEPLVTTDVWRLYVAALPSGQLGLMKIAATSEMNDVLNKEEGILQIVQQAASDADDEAEGQGKRPYYFGAQVPAVIESFNAGGRHAMVLRFHPCIATYKQFTPLSLVVKDSRVDLQTSVWLLGKSLRLIDFLYRVCGIAIGHVGASNTLIETEQHGVFVPDFSSANDSAVLKDHLAEVALVTRMVWEAAGGTDSKDPPYDAGIMTVDQHAEFVEFLRRMINDPQIAAEEHEALYELANRIWPKVPGADGNLKRPFHGFCTYPR